VEPSVKKKKTTGGVANIKPVAAVHDGGEGGGVLVDLEKGVRQKYKKVVRESKSGG